jgi:hypothetical protein
LARNITTASSSDTKLFHYLLRRQRSVECRHTTYSNSSIQRPSSRN